MFARLINSFMDHRKWKPINLSDVNRSQSPGIYIQFMLTQPQYNWVVIYFTRLNLISLLCLPPLNHLSSLTFFLHYRVLWLFEMAMYTVYWPLRKQGNWFVSKHLVTTVNFPDSFLQLRLNNVVLASHLRGTNKLSARVKTPFYWAC